MVAPDVVGIGSEYFVVYFRVYIYVRPVYHYIAATVVYLAQRIITACVVVILILYYPICKFQSLILDSSDTPNIEVDKNR